MSLYIQTNDNATAYLDGNVKNCRVVSNRNDSNVSTISAQQKRRMESIRDLNNNGVACIIEGSSSCASQYLRASLDEAIGMASIETLQMVSNWEQHYLRTSIAFQNMIMNQNKKSSPVSTEYDEGMSVFTDIPIAVDKNNSNSLALDSLTATVLFNQGILNLRQNNDAEAFICFSQSLFFKQQRDNASSSTCGVSLVAILHSIGYVHYRNSNFDDALNTYTQAFNLEKDATATAVMSSHSILEMSSTLNCLGVVYYHMPQNDNDNNKIENIRMAIEAYAKSLAIRRRVIGADQDDINVATTLNNLGCAYYMSGDHKKALQFHTDALNMRCRFFGLVDANIDVAASSFNVAQAHHQLGNLAEAMQLYEMFMNILAMCGNGENQHHRDMANGLRGIAQIHYDREEFSIAIELYQKALDICKATSCSSSPSHDVASILNTLGGILFEQKDFDGAIKCYKEGLEIEIKLYGLIHPNIVITLNNLGHIYDLRGDHECCLHYFEKAVEIQRKTSGDYHPTVSASLLSIAGIHHRTKNYSEEFHVYQEILRIHREVHGQQHLHVAATLSSIGHVLFNMDLHEFALQIFEESLQMLRSLANEKIGNNNNNGINNANQDVACILCNIAAIHLKLDDSEDKSLLYYNEALNIQRRELGESHEDVIATLEQIGYVYQQRGELHESMKYLNKALQIRLSKASSARNNDTKAAKAIAQTLNNLGNLYLQSGQTAQMVSTFSDALRYLRQVKSSGVEYYDDLVVTGIHFYELSKMHPECAPIA